MHAPRGTDVSRSLVAMVGEGEDNLARYSSVSFESYATLVELIICTLAQGWFPYTMQKTCFPSGELRHNAANQTQSQL